MQQQEVLFAPRFLEKYVGKAILYDPKIAIMELIANAWDAGATKVEIKWPDYKREKTFSITDNGIGMSDDELNHRWRQLAYNKISEQGEYITFNNVNKRRVFGKNGVGRFAGFCFGDNYYIETSKGTEQITYQVQKSTKDDVPFVLQKIGEEKVLNSGTKIFTDELFGVRFDSSEIKSEIGMRFLIDPNFEVFVDNEKVSFSDISNYNLSEKTIEVDNDKIKLLIIDTKESDKSTKLHGVAWHVDSRLVGECNWNDSHIDFDKMIDGRSNEAKRYTFIIVADCLREKVTQDWTGFIPCNKVHKVQEEVYSHIQEYILDLTKEKRKEVLDKASSTHYDKLDRLTKYKKEKWEKFVNDVQESCPTISDKDIIKLSGILATLELSSSKYQIISLLHDMEPNQFDDLHDILKDWNIEYAKEVLDELKVRIKLLDELKIKINNKETDEVQELQPLFEKGLWIFGPEFETIEYTSNEGMTKVVQRLFKLKEKASQNRPDFAVLPDSTVGLYSYPKYDEDFAEIGTDKLIIVELKKPTVNIGSDEKSQCWKYVSELYEKGHLLDDSKVKCFVLGSQIKKFEINKRTENDGRVEIVPLTYDTIINRAKSRLLKLYDKVQNAPFLHDKNE